MQEHKPDFNRLKKVLLRDGEPDIVPFFEFLIDEEIISALTGNPVTPESTVEFYHRFGYDYVMVKANYGYQVDELVATDVAALSRGQRRFANENAGPIQTRQEFDSYAWQKIDAAVANPMKAVGQCLPAGMKMIIRPPKGILENVTRLMGFVPFSYALYEDEQLVADLFERIGENHIKIIQTCLDNADHSKIGAVALGDDMGGSQSTLISPELLREYVFPWQKRIADLAHQYDLPMILHSCGNLEGIMEDLINYVGIDAKHSFEDKIQPITQVKQKYGNRIALLGGIDVHALCTDNENELRLYVREIMRVCSVGGGYALGTGNSVANYIPVRNYLIMLEEGRSGG